MEKVLKQAQVLGELILDSDEYKAMREAELAVTKDENCTAMIMKLAELRQKVEDILSSNEMDHSALAEAGKELEDMDAQVSELPLVKKMQEARGQFTYMMDNVNQIIRFVITGETGEEHEGGCTGSCSSCSGCHH
ncbi:MAG: YlbF family regulator [Clostridia bacterium]|nr:YlbF family regulator [Clostridia bacterium]